MLNIETCEKIVNDLNNINALYKKQFQSLIDEMTRLHRTKLTAIKSIQYVERYFYSLAKKPKNFDLKIEEIKPRYIEYNDLCKTRQQEYEEMINNHLSNDVLRNAGLLALSPNAAMAAAMACGNVSTSLALSSISGVSAINTSLAWLNSALSLGGTSLIASGSIFSVIGPVGIAVNGISLLTLLLKINKSNKEISREAEKSIVEIKKEITRIKGHKEFIDRENKEIILTSNNIMKTLNKLKCNRKRDYWDFTDLEKQNLIVILNASETLSKKLSKTVIGEK